METIDPKELNTEIADFKRDPDYEHYLYTIDTNEELIFDALLKEEVRNDLTEEVKREIEEKWDVGRLNALKEFAAGKFEEEDGEDGERKGTGKIGFGEKMGNMFRGKFWGKSPKKKPTKKDKGGGDQGIPPSGFKDPSPDNKKPVTDQSMLPGELKNTSLDKMPKADGEGHRINIDLNSKGNAHIPLDYNPKAQRPHKSTRNLILSKKNQM